MTPEPLDHPNSDNNTNDQRFDVFLSHNGRDKPVARELARALKARGLRPWLDEDELPLGLPWQERLEAAIERSSSFAMLIGPNGIGPWQDEEMRAALMLARKRHLPVIPVLLAGAPPMSNLPPFLGNRTGVEMRAGLTPDAIDRLARGIPRTRQGSGDAAPMMLVRSAGRFLRRRARVQARGSKPFVSILHALMSRQHTRSDRDEAVHKFEGSWESLKHPFERTMAQAIYLEGSGAIEAMLAVLEAPRFSGTAESTRLLYEAIACEKLDDYERAQRLLRTILDTERQRGLIRAAQFNLQVCYEKAQNFAQVRFEAFFQDRDISFVDRERLSDKAVAMHMIACMEQHHPFLHKRLLADSLDYLRQNSPIGHAKTLLTKVESERSTLTQIDADTIMEDVKLMDANSRTAILVRVADLLPPEAQARRASILARVQQEPVHSETLAKWTRIDRSRAQGDGDAADAS